MKMHLPPTEGHQALIFSCYTLKIGGTVGDANEDKDRFYNLLNLEVQRVPPSDKFILIVAFNARVGIYHIAWEGVNGNRRMRKLNNNRLPLLAFYSQNRLIISSTSFYLKDIYRST